jgi:hypothetical protein
VKSCVVVDVEVEGQLPAFLQPASAQTRTSDSLRASKGSCTRSSRLQFLQGTAKSYTGFCPSDNIKSADQFNIQSRNILGLILWAPGEHCKWMGFCSCQEKAWVYCTRLHPTTPVPHSCKVPSFIKLNAYNYSPWYAIYLALQRVPLG